MKNYFLISLLCLITTQANAGDITCSDATSVSSEARILLHAAAQKRAQKAAENLIKRKIVKPHVNLFKTRSTPEKMASLIENYWCDPPSKALHKAYFGFYTNAEYVFE